MKRIAAFFRLSTPFGRALRNVVASAAAAAGANSLASAQCGWSTDFDAPGTGQGMSHRVYDMTVFDDGTGGALQLIAGGDFTAAGSAPTTERVASFNGSAWAPVGSGGVTDASVFGVTSFTGTPFGIATLGSEIYAGGAFTTMDSVAANHVSLFDGFSWLPVPDTTTGVDGVNGDVYTLITHDFGFPFSPMLIVGGQFTLAGGKPANNVAFWTASGGFIWGPFGNPLCGGGTAGGIIPGRVDALCVFDDGSGEALYVGGYFTSVDCGTPASLVAKFDPFTWTWSAVGALTGSNVYDLVVFDDGTGPALYAGGNLPSMGHVVKWNGSTWSTVGVGLNDAVRDLLDYKCTGRRQLIAAGHFTASGDGTLCPRVSRLSGANWLPLDSAALGLSGGTPPIALCMADFDDGVNTEDLYVGGIFSQAEGQPSSFIASTCACAVAPFPMIEGEVAVTTMGVDPEDFVLSLVDVRPPYPAPNTDWEAPMFHNEWAPSAPSETWTLGNLGQVFGVCLDGATPPNIYVAATSVYPSLWSFFTADGPGAVFKIDGSTGDISNFLTTGTGAIGTNTLPNTGPALGDICYDRFHDQFFVSNFEDGKIYRIKNGLVAQVLDPFGADSGAAGLAPVGELVWAVQVFNPRQLYFSRWSEDLSNGPFATDNSIWVAGLMPGGAFSGATIKAIDLPAEPGQAFAMPCSDITFSQDNKRMLIAQRTIAGGTGSGAHGSAVQEFIGGNIGNATGWTRTGADDFWIGAYGANLNAAGGADYDCAGAVYATGDALKYQLDDYIYGLQRVPPGGNTSGAGATSTSQIHDMNGDKSTSDKIEIGECEVLRRTCKTSSWNYCTSKLNSLGCYPLMSSAGEPSASQPNGFVVSATELIAQTQGVIFYSTTGPAAAPFQGGTLCLAAPLRRTQVASSGGALGTCSGAISIDMNAYAFSGANPALSVPGAAVYCQCWSRDAASPSTTSLTDGLVYFVAP